MKSKRLSQLGTVIKKIDIFAAPVELMIQKRRQHQSLFGAFMTLVMFGCIATYIIDKFIQLGQRKDFQTLYSEVYYEEVPTYALFSSNFTLQFAFQTQNQQNYIDETVYQVNAFLINRQQTGINNQLKYTQTQTEIPLTKCSNIGIKFEQLYDQLDYVDLSNTYCLNWDQMDELSLTGTQGQDNFTYIYLTFSECVNKTSDANSPICKSKEQIQTQLNRNYILFQLSSYNIDLRNYEEPQVPKVEEVQTTISSQVIKDITIFMQPITTLTEDGLLSALVRQDSTIRYLKNQEIIDFNSDESLATVIIKLADTENVSYRIYPKLQDIFAQAGGLWELLLLFFTIIVRPFQQISYKLDIINSLFNFEGQKQEENKEDHHATIRKRLTMQPDTVQTNENETSIILNGSNRVKISARFPKGRTKTKSLKQEPLNPVVSEKTSQVFTNSPENDKLIQRGIRAALRKLFQIANFKIRLNPLEFIKYLKWGQKEGKFKQLQYSVQKLEKCLDILFIIDKLQEIDKLKMILLSKQQVKLFEYLPKPMICLDPQNQEYNENVYYSSLLRPHKSTKEKAQEAQQVLDELLENLDDPISNKLIQLMDPDIIKLLQMQSDMKRNILPKIVSNETVNNE